MEESILSRRHAFKIAGLAGAAVALADRVSFAESPASKPAAPAESLPQGAGFYRTHVGEFEVTIVSDGGLPQSPPYPTWGRNASKEAVENLLRDNFLDPADLVGQVNAVLIRRGNGPYTLIDTGTGKLFGPVLGFLRQNLAAAGVPIDSIAAVVFTHLHPDHCGGALDADGKPVFANARHFVHKKERDFWAGPSPDLSKAGVPDELKTAIIGAAKKTITALGDQLQTFDGDTHDIFPGLTATLMPGHTPGLVTLTLKSGNESLLYFADTAHQYVLSFAHPEWLLAFDAEPEQAVATRQKIYAMAAESRVLASGSHLPFPSLGHVKKDGNAYAWVPTPWRWS